MGNEPRVSEVEDLIADCDSDAQRLVAARAPECPKRQVLNREVAISYVR
jgi:hypothetical protein